LAGRGKIIDRDSGYRQFMKNAKMLEGKPHVKVGFPEESTGPEAKSSRGTGEASGATISDEGLTIAQVATFHEFGGKNDHPPERSFIRRTVYEKDAEINGMIKSEMKTFFLGNPLTALGRVGLFVQSAIQRLIHDRKLKPNEPSTIARKGSDTPLIDTGQLVQSVRYVVVSSLGKAVE